MGIFSELYETRSSAQSITTSASIDEWNTFFSAGSGSFNSNKAMKITAVYSAVSFLADQFSSLPLHINKKNGQPSTSKVAALFANKLNDNYLSESQFRRAMAISVLLNGRAFAEIQRNKDGQIVAVIPINFEAVTPVMRGGVLQYDVHMAGRTSTLSAREIIDLNPNPATDGVSHYNPIEANASTLALAHAVENFTKQSFENGGVPPLQLVTAANVEASPEAQERAEKQVQRKLNEVRSRTAQSIRSNTNKNILKLPSGYELKSIGLDHTKLQLLELRQWLTVEICRIWRLPKIYLNESDGGTFSNVEHQAASLIKNTLLPQLIAPFEAEMNMKLASGGEYFRMNLNGFVRGDFKTQMDALKSATSAGIYSINESREYIGLPPIDGGDVHVIQSAMTKLSMVGQNFTKEEEISDEQ